MNERILVADDDDDIRGLVTFTLRSRGYNVLEAHAGDTALELVRAERPNLAVLDVGMPGLNGIEVAAAMKEDMACAAIPIIILSAKGQSAEIEQGLSGLSTKSSCIVRRRRVDSVHEKTACHPHRCRSRRA